MRNISKTELQLKIFHILENTNHDKNTIHTMLRGLQKYQLILLLEQLEEQCNINEHLKYFQAQETFAALRGISK